MAKTVNQKIKLNPKKKPKLTVPKVQVPKISKTYF